MKLTSTKLSTKVNLPNGEEIDLEIIPEYTELEGPQKDFLVNYISTNLQKTKSLLLLGLRPEMFAKWSDNEKFVSAFDTVKSLYTEAMRSQHLKDSFSNSKIRVKTLAALEAEGFEEKGKLQAKNQQNNFYVGDSMADIIQQIKKLTD